MTTIANFKDPLLKREQFSISLRKKKKQAIIMSKRKRSEWGKTEGTSPIKGETDCSESKTESEDELFVIINSLMP
jgi:hypothetical protein